MGYAAAEDTGKVLAVVHSHPGAPFASEPDKKVCDSIRLAVVYLRYGRRKLDKD